jgi:hypothetical protein
MARPMGIQSHQQVCAKLWPCRSRCSSFLADPGVVPHDRLAIAQGTDGQCLHSHVMLKGRDAGEGGYLIFFSLPLKDKISPP